MTFLIVVLRGFLRRPWLAAALVYVILIVGFASNTAAAPPLGLAAAGLMVGVILYVILRWGVLASIVMGTVYGWLLAAPLTLDAASWYAGRSFLVLGACAAIAIYGLVVSLGRQPIFGTPLWPNWDRPRTG